ncbi:phosphoglycerate kinase [Candidatus Woesearchaeota archaeon]|nr:phosphoglycerate kinase [Candidatus Woesearchaeota archaeon]
MVVIPVSHLALHHAKIFLRVDLNVLQNNGVITDDSKLRAAIPTIQYLLERNCTLILATHWGDPKGKIVPELKTDALAAALQKLMKRKVTKLPDCIGKDIKMTIDAGKPGSIFMLENLRFYAEEEEDNPAFAHALASLAEMYVNDAFAVCHRKHASVHAMTRFIHSAAGLLIEKEIENLNKALNPLRPAIWIMGGAKLDKIELLQQALRKADYILIGGALAFPFLKARGISVGMSKIDTESVKVAASILKQKESRKIVLPVDFMAAEKFTPLAPARAVGYNEIGSGEIALDIGSKTIELFKSYLRKAQTIVWNGPLGYFEWAKFATGTKEIGRYVGKLTAITICGGGETAAAIHKFHLQHNLTHVSTGGGATLQYLAGKKLPGLVALEENAGRFKGKIM